MANSRFRFLFNLRNSSLVQNTDYGIATLMVLLLTTEYQDMIASYLIYPFN